MSIDARQNACIQAKNVCIETIKMQEPKSKFGNSSRQHRLIRSLHKRTCSRWLSGEDGFTFVRLQHTTISARSIFFVHILPVMVITKKLKLSVIEVKLQRLEF